MQRTVVLIRHAKSSWANPLQSDFERPLNERGIKDAPVVGERLKSLHTVPDLIISSTAKRAKETAKKIAEAVGYERDRIQWVDKLYHCIPSVFEEVIGDIDGSVKTVFVIAHNPGITDYANELSDNFSVDNMPTCAAVGARAEAEQWADFRTAQKQVFLFEYPKKIYAR